MITIGVQTISETWPGACLTQALTAKRLEIDGTHLVAIRGDVRQIVPLSLVRGKIYAETVPNEAPTHVEMMRLRAERDQWKAAYSDAYAENAELRKRRDDLFEANNQEVERKRAEMREKLHWMSVAAVALKDAEELRSALHDLRHPLGRPKVCQRCFQPFYPGEATSGGRYHLRTDCQSIAAVDAAMKAKP